MAPTRTPRQPAGTRRAAAPRSRPTTTSRPRPGGLPIRRRKPQPESNAKKVLGAVTTALPGLLEKAGAPAKKAKPNSRKGGAGLALLAGGAGFAALKNRNKLPGKLGGRSEPEPMTPTVPAEPVVVTAPPINEDRPHTPPA